MIDTSFREYWRCPDEYSEAVVGIPEVPTHLAAELRDLLSNGPLPSGLGAAVDYLRRERYIDNDLAETSRGLGPKALARRAYYFLRPFMPVAIRVHFQRLALAGWNRIPFPRWPVETAVDDLLLEAWRGVFAASGESEVPFIWFWPHRHRSCAIMTHDVETAAGRDLCPKLMAMEAERGIRASFQIIPEVRYEVTEEFLAMIREGGGEVGLHGLNHDGSLFTSEDEFERRVEIIRGYAEKYRTAGFRSPVMYRNIDWLERLPASYDMSVPNLGHLDPQRGGCCTVMPFFLGPVLELPLTTTQDYFLQNLIRDWSVDLWQQQMAIIRERHGLMSFVIHPDYTLTARAQRLFGELLDELAAERDTHNAWLPLPGEIDDWWRQRQAMELVRRDGTWVIEGEGAERAVVARAILDNGSVAVEVPAG